MTNVGLHQIVLEGERLLFEKRLQQMSAQMIEKSIRNFLKHFKEYIPFANNSSVLTDRHLAYIRDTFKLLERIVSTKLLRCNRHDPKDTNSGANTSEFCHIHGDTPVLKGRLIESLNLFCLSHNLLIGSLFLLLV